MSNRQFTYYAFISYSRLDASWAEWLQCHLESYRPPSVSLRIPGAQLPKYIRPVFRDKTDLSGGQRVEEALSRELENSRWLIVVCSPRAAKSFWVNREVKHFLDLGRGDRIIPFIVDGNPDAKDLDQRCYPPALPTDVLGVSLEDSDKNKEKALVRLVAVILGCPPDMLWDRHRRRQLKERRLLTVAAVVVTGLVALGVISAINAHQTQIKAHQAQLILMKKQHDDVVQCLKRWLEMDRSEAEIKLEEFYTYPMEHMSPEERYEFFEAYSKLVLRIIDFPLDPSALTQKLKLKVTDPLRELIEKDPEPVDRRKRLQQAKCIAVTTLANVKLLGKAAGEESLRNADTVAQWELSKLRKLRPLPESDQCDTSVSGEGWGQVTELEYELYLELSKQASKAGFHVRAEKEAKEAMQLAPDPLKSIDARLNYARVLKNGFDPSAPQQSKMALEEAQRQYDKSITNDLAMEALTRTACAYGEILWFWGNCQEAYGIHTAHEKMVKSLFEEKGTSKTLDTLIVTWKWLGYEGAELEVTGSADEPKPERWPLQALQTLDNKRAVLGNDNEVLRQEAELWKAVGYCRNKRLDFEKAMEAHEKGIAILASLLLKKDNRMNKQRLANARLHAARTEIGRERYKNAIEGYINPGLKTMQELLQTSEGERNYYWRENAADLHYEKARAIFMIIQRDGDTDSESILAEIITSSLLRAPILKRDSSNARIRGRVDACTKLETEAFPAGRTPGREAVRNACAKARSQYNEAVVLDEDIDRLIAQSP